jgi:hypothetical protein
VAADEVLDRFESVDYTLHPTYGDRLRQLVDDRMSNFALKELAWGAWGESIVRATITIRNQQTLVKLNRYINLTEMGPRLCGYDLRFKYRCDTGSSRHVYCI